MKYQHNFNPTISDEDIFNEIIREKEYIGYYNLVHQDTSLFKEYASTVKQKNIIVIGIGGSTLGTYAIYKFLKYSKNLTKKLYFLETTDPIDIKSKVKNIDLNDTLFIVISKSGTTIETVSIFKYINSLVKCDKHNTLVVTESDSKLSEYAKANEIRNFEIPKNVGGRFSVFSAVGLLPLAIVGIDIDELLRGAKEVHDSFFAKDETYARVVKKARFFVEYKNSFNINVVFSYSSRLEGFNKWYIQLWGESLGKVDINSSRQGLTPIGIIGPIDQHSFLQLIVEGRRDKTVTVIKVNDFDNDLKIPQVRLEGLDELDYLDNIEFSSLINKQADATIESINNLHDIPCDVMTIDSVRERSIASLMYEYELLTSVCAKFMYINAYDQPGVEAGKTILKQKLEIVNR
ncbi:MAG: glucose-6-phosphate isomerase [Sulfurimonas sp. RIFCSPLOWO2_12_FULL_36_74]|uniref:glucose-6-phosphate isomerase n=1 Tax=unclassified Sulfurimonas TaxID=2623549 RepID=UPI0008C87E46|nr:MULTISPECIES: glucose-6-phosphate isomerase [unclassified Sulfurimonas]OHD98616.1 MAG: glucose-6-phosphate isomerase [Sulfurimonas sp. RIFCSPLOWO2_02_FULL_36_28]OHE02570.1 MAG: glucose-6-phosphate isomerase [Sulfurimonas sp. RIFCSPLOWO2_12_36_12]OHE06719.1 MAG: glucose-6-phosphate isomerase [Sulfurimonas sp. RIFCSPLOWO2_12_FULL_36_74]